MKRFSKFHPCVSFSYFMLIILLTVIIKNPVYILLSFTGAFFYRLRLAGRQAFYALRFILPLIIFAGLFNMIFSHYGVTVLFSVFGNDFMLESLMFGLFTGAMLGSVMFWFACYTEVITSEKFMALFGRSVPDLALLFSMVLRFIPLLLKTSQEIKEAGIGMGIRESGIKSSINRFSSLVSISLEKSMETADSMKGRGFGGRKRKPYIRYKFQFTDAALLTVTVLLVAVMAAGVMFNINSFLFEPEMKFINSNIFFYALFGLFSFIPVIIDLAGELKWHLLRLKI